MAKMKILNNNEFILTCDCGLKHEVSIDESTGEVSIDTTTKREKTPPKEEKKKFSFFNREEK